MAIYVNNTEITETGGTIIIGNTNVEKVICNGVTVWTKYIPTWHTSNLLNGVSIDKAGGTSYIYGITSNSYKITAYCTLYSTYSFSQQIVPAFFPEFMGRLGGGMWTKGISYRDAMGSISLTVNSRGTYWELSASATCTSGKIISPITFSIEEYY